MKLFNKEVSNQKVVIATATLAVLLAGGVFAWQYLERLKEKPMDWNGTYEYGEFAPPNQTWAYVLMISKTNKQFDAELDIDGFQTLTRIQAVARERSGNLDLIFDSYRAGNIGDVYKKGDLLFSLERLSDSKYKVLWSTLKSNLLTPPVDAAFTKISSAVSKDETADWQTYRNEEYRFSMRYPPGFFFEESSNGVAFIENQWRGKLVHYPLIGVEFIEASLTPKEWVDAFGTERSVFDESLPLPECVSGSQVRCLYFGVKDRKNISLGADKVSALQFYNSGVSGSNDNTLTTDTKRNVLVNIYRHSSGIGEISWDVYNQMLSTLKFLE